MLEVYLLRLIQNTSELTQNEIANELEIWF
jgi:hypothetical protein